MGTRVTLLFCVEVVKDHPHACGDKRCGDYSAEDVEGSSPRVWGQVVVLCRKPLFLRIIPTRVGTRKSAASRRGRHEDHPHACGDKKKYGGYDLDTTGSSPRVWGQDILNFFDTGFCRIIPTRVGTRKYIQISQDLTEDHPHACGDKTKEIKENSGFAKSTA